MLCGRLTKAAYFGLMARQFMGIEAGSQATRSTITLPSQPDKNCKSGRSSGPSYRVNHSTLSKTGFGLGRPIHQDDGIELELNINQTQQGRLTDKDRSLLKGELRRENPKLAGQVAP